jgi:hypothetical protein
MHTDVYTTIILSRRPSSVYTLPHRVSNAARRGPHVAATRFCVIVSTVLVLVNHWATAPVQGLQTKIANDNITCKI